MVLVIIKFEQSNYKYEIPENAKTENEIYFNNCRKNFDTKSSK